MKSKKIPILLIAHRRPKETQKVLEKIKTYYPEKLYYFVDNSDEIDLQTQKVKELIINIDCASNIYTKFPKFNLGCGLGPVTAINWVFSNEKYAIILEDDCVPLKGFFEFMEWWLIKKQNDENCLMISGNNYSIIGKKPFTMKTRFAFTHGWATWRRAWQGYDYNIRSWNTKKFDKKFIPIYAYRKHWIKIFNKIKIDSIKTYWDYQWQFHIWKKKGFALQPPVNLILNIGFNKNATHTFDVNDLRGKIPLRTIPVNFRNHSPKFSIINEITNMIIDLNIASFVIRFYLKLKKILNL